MNVLWLVPLGIGAMGAVGMAVVARTLLRSTEQLERSLQPLRTDRRDRRSGTHR